MNKYYLTLPCATLHTQHSIHRTAREHARYTTSWFLTGKRPALNDINQVNTTRGALPC
jgi:hypothetical protein